MSYPLSAKARTARSVLSALAACLFAAAFAIRAQAAVIEVDAGVAGGDCCVFQTISAVPGMGTNNTTVNVGDTVHWVWRTDAHSVTSDTDAWPDSGVHNTGFTYNMTFTTAGVYTYYCIIHGDSGMVGTITVAAPGASLAGRLALEGVPDLSAIHAPLGAFQVEFRKPGTSGVVFAAAVTLKATGKGSPFGTFSIGSVPTGIYDIAVKGGKNLRVVTTGVSVTGAATLTDTALPTGDSNNDNTVDVLDFGNLVNAYGSKTSDPNSGYDPNVDFDFNGAIDVLDFGILVNNYGLQGAL